MLWIYFILTSCILFCAYMCFILCITLKNNVYNQVSIFQIFLHDNICFPMMYPFSCKLYPYVLFLNISYNMLVVYIITTHLPHTTLRWRHNDHAGVSNHQPHSCLLNRLFRRKSKKTSKLRVTGHCAGNSPGTGEFPAQMASYAENVSIWWRHHEYVMHQ